MTDSRAGNGKFLPRIGLAYDSWMNAFGALFCAAAFLWSLPYCRAQLRLWLPAVAYLGLAGAAIFISSRLPPGNARYGIALFAAALAVRLLWALSAAFPPRGDDYEHYRSVSLELLQGRWEELYVSFWPWGYFLYLGGLARIFGTSLTVPVAANAVVGALTTLLVYAIAWRCLGERRARVAAVVYSLWPGVIFWSSVLCTEIPHLLLFLAALLCLLVGLEARAHGWIWLVAGGLLASLAEFTRALSPLLLLPLAFYACTRRDLPARPAPPARGLRGWRAALTAFGTYAICLGALLTLMSRMSGYPHFSTSYTLGMNLAFGLNWDSRGTFNAKDALDIYSDDPRETNRRGLELAEQRLREMWRSDWRRLFLLAAMKFQENWSLEAAGYAVNHYAVPEDQRGRHWLVIHGYELEAVAQWFHSAVLALAMIGFWNCRRWGGLAFLASILLAFVLLHIPMEVDGRYHFAAQALIAIASAGALNGIGKPAPTDPGRARPTTGSSRKAGS